MKKHTRRIAAVLASAALLAVIFSCLFLIANAEHDCDGADCRICDQILFCIQTLNPSAAAAPAAALSALAFLFSREKGRSRAPFRTACSPVSLKVKLSN